MKTILSVIVLFFISFFIMGVQGAEIPESIKKQAHSESECGVKVIKNRNIDDIKILKEKPDFAKIIVLQCQYDKIDEDTASVLMNWVAGGGTLWFYDSRLAHYFGMESSPVNPQGTLAKPMDGEFGDTRKFPGMAVIASAYGGHPVLTGVTGAAVFILKIGEEQYSAVKSGGDVKALLKIDLASDNAISAIKETGKGKIILKTLLWPDQIDGGRLQVNMLEYSAGFPIPQITEKDSPVTDEMLVPSKAAEEWKEVDLLELSDGRKIWGKIGNLKIDFEGVEKSGSFKPEQLKSIVLGSKGRVDAIVTYKDKEYKGFVSPGADGFLFTTPSGSKIKLEKNQLKSIIFNIDKESMEREHPNT